MEFFRTFLKIGLLSFGGPAAQIALMHRMIVEENQWLDEKQFLNALSFCMLLPGPEAMQLSTYAGWRLQGVRGGLVAGLLFVLPGALVVLLLAILYVYVGDTPVVDSIFLGIKAAVLVIVLHALERLSRRALDGLFHSLLAAVSFVAIFFLQLPFPLIILLASIAGALQVREHRQTTLIRLPDKALRQSLYDTALWLLVWWLPVIAIGLLGGSDMLVALAMFFSKLAVVTFGGAYAVLAYMAQDVVLQHGWLTTVEMVDGLGLAETTPGPLILVTEFVGFVAAFKEGGLMFGIAGAMIVLWVTFVPCFLWIFVGAPYIDWLGAQPRLQGAMSAITAAVVGVILNLSIWFTLHVMFSQVNEIHRGPFTLWLPELATLDWRVPLLAILCGWLLLKLHWSVLKVLGVSALAGLLVSLL